MRDDLPRRDFIKLASLGVGASVGMGADCAAESEPKGGTGRNVVREPAREVPVVHECDVCVIGGGCTGTFAAVAAARQGASVALVEWNGFLGGVATASLVNRWHSLKNRSGDRPIIAGLTAEVLSRLRERDALRDVGRDEFDLNSEVLKIELDGLVKKAGIRPFLHAMFVSAVVEDGRMIAAIIEDKSGRRAIRARQFVDATGDGDVAARLGLPVYKRENLQPPTMCCILRDLKEVRRRHPGFNVNRAVFNKEYDEAIRKGFSWSASVPGAEDHTMLAGTRVFGADCSDADQLTRAELEGRRQVRSICNLLRNHFTDGKDVPLAWLPAKIGIRETRHVRCLHTLKTGELLRGKRFPDAIANGTYRIDVHSAHGAGVKFRDLKDTEFYQVPYRSLVPQGSRNVLVAGRCLDADEEAFGAVRVMVNCNQMGQAAGVASWLALDSGKDLSEIDTDRLRDALKKQGAIVI